MIVNWVSIGSSTLRVGAQYPRMLLEEQPPPIIKSLSVHWRSHNKEIKVVFEDDRELVLHTDHPISVALGADWLLDALRD